MSTEALHLQVEEEEIPLDLRCEQLSAQCQVRSYALLDHHPLIGKSVPACFSLLVVLETHLFWLEPMLHYEISCFISQILWRLPHQFHFFCGKSQISFTVS